MNLSENKPFFPLISAHFLTFLIVGLPLPVIPLYVHNHLGFSESVAGLCIGAHFMTTVLFRGLAGRFIDTRGGRRATLTGALICAASGAPYLAVALPMLPVSFKLACILAGRVCLGMGHSLIGTGTLAWGFGLLGPNHAGRVISWTGISMYAGVALGAPVGLLLWDFWGIAALGAASCLLPLLSVLCISLIRGAPVEKKNSRPAAGKFLPLVLRPGVCLALHGVGNAAVNAFIVLYFTVNGWGHAGLALTCFGFSFIAARLLCGEMPDKAPGSRPALFALLAETAGLALLAFAPSPLAAFAGIALTGMGCSMVYPSIGAQVVRLVPVEVRGTAIGWFSAFQDVSFGVTGPLTGLLIPAFGYPAVFFTAAACAALSFVIMLLVADKTDA